MGIFFIEAVKKSLGIKILSLVITFTFFSQKQVIHFQIIASAPVKMRKNVDLPFPWADSVHFKKRAPTLGHRV